MAKEFRKTQMVPLSKGSLKKGWNMGWNYFISLVQANLT
jgi:hypothetical protein